MCVRRVQALAKTVDGRSLKSTIFPSFSRVPLKVSSAKYLFLFLVGTKEKPITDDSLANNIGEMKTDLTFADAKLVCDGVTIPCHRVILAARSECFKSLFTQGFTEGDIKRMNLT